MYVQPVALYQIPHADRQKYEEQFRSLRSKDGFVDSITARNFFSTFMLPQEYLMQMWECSDVNKDGRLDMTEFCVAMHILNRQLLGGNRPNTPQNFTAPLQRPILPRRRDPELQKSVSERRREKEELLQDRETLREELSRRNNELEVLTSRTKEKKLSVTSFKNSVREKTEEMKIFTEKLEIVKRSCSELETQRRTLEKSIVDVKKEKEKWSVHQNDVKKNFADPVDSAMRTVCDRLEKLTQGSLESSRALNTARSVSERQENRLRMLTLKGKELTKENSRLAEKFRVLQASLKSQKTSQQELIISDRYLDSEYATMAADYHGETESELTFSEGDTIKVLKKSDDGWWLGEDSHNHQGYFPANFIRPPGEPAPALIHVEYYLALYCYSAQNSDELSFEANDVIEILSSSDLDADWFMGKLVGTDETGLVPANYLRKFEDNIDGSDAAPEDIPKEEIKIIESPHRQQAIQELIETEEKYLEDVRTVFNIFSPALKERGVCTKEELALLFNGWHSIMELTERLVKEFHLRAKRNNTGRVEQIGDILCERFPEMAPFYIAFCSSQIKISEFIQQKSSSSPSFADILRNCSDNPGMRKLPLTASFVKPMQRITRYPLLIKNILENTPENHFDFNDLKNALRRAELLATEVNEGVRATELEERFDWIQNNISMNDFTDDFVFNSQTNSMGHRQLFYFGSLNKVKGGRELVAFLFNDFFLLTTPPRPMLANSGNSTFDKKSWMDVSLKLYKKPLLLAGCKVDHFSDDFIFHLTFPGNIHIPLRAPTAAECRSWIKHIEQAVANCDDMEKRIKLGRSRSTGHQSPIGCVRVIILEGNELEFRLSQGRCNSFCKVSVGSQEMRTTVAEGMFVPKWDQNMSFIIHDLENDFLCLTVLNYNPFAPNEFLGKAELRLGDLYRESKTSRIPVVKRVLLHDVESGEVVIKIDIQLFQAAAVPEMCRGILSIKKRDFLIILLLNFVFVFPGIFLL